MTRTAAPTLSALVAAASWWVEVPVDLGREEARDLARRELADPAYDDEPSWLQEAVGWLLDRIHELLSRTTGALGGWVGIAIMVALLVFVAYAVIYRMGPMARRARSRAPVFEGAPRTSAEYRAAADEAASRGDWSSAVVERYRAIVAGLEERGILDQRPGRTADEAAAEGGSALPVVAGGLGVGAGLFDAVRYGGRSATSDDDDALRHLDDAVMAARHAPAAVAAGLPPGAPP
jgi:hypothetical protein